MEVLLSLTIGVLYAAGVYMIMRRSLVKLIIGLALLSHGANLFLFTVGGLSRGRPPLLMVEPTGGGEDAREIADPLPQALLLTAIVIGFAVQAFSLVLFKRVYRVTGSDDLDDLIASESPTRVSGSPREETS